MLNRDGFFAFFFDIFDAKKNKIEIDKNQILNAESMLNSYSECVIKWGAIHNIISSKFDKQNVFEIIADSIIGGTVIEVKNEIYDVGSGGGFPGIPMAIINPQTKYHLVEADRKKCSFLRTVKSELNLSNIVIQNCRIESLVNLPAIISKAAFAPKNMSYLINALAPGASMALWATPMTEKEYLEESKKHAVVLVREYFYELPQEKKRVVMIFRKS